MGLAISYIKSLARVGLVSISVILGYFASTVQAVDLPDFVADTISAHPDVREQVHIFRQVVEDKVIAKSGWRPSVDLEASAGTFRSESPVTGPDSVEFESTRAELSVTQNLFNGFDTTNQIKQTNARINSELYELFDIADNIALAAAQAYLELLKQQRLYELAVKNVKAHQDTLERIRVRSESGVGRRSQLEQTEGRVARAKASLIAQENNLQDAATELHQVAGRYINPEELVEPEIPERVSLDIENLTAQALKQHPAIRVAEHNIEAAEFDYRRSLSKRRPSVDLRLAQELGQDINGLEGSTDDLSLILSLNYNLYKGGANKALARQKISSVHELQQFAARTRRQVINTLRLAWAAENSLSSQLSFLQEHVDKSKATLASYQEEFFIGQRDLIDVLDAENELNSAQNAYANAYFDFLSARFRIREGVGSLFAALKLDAKVEDQDFQISKIQAVGQDKLPYPDDRDVDKVINPDDQCDNSIIDNQVGRFGCADSLSIEFDENNVRGVAPSAGEGDVADQSLSPVDDVLALGKDMIITFSFDDLLSNDGEEDNELQLEGFTQPLNGELALDASGESNLIYRPIEGFIGRDRFNYTVVDKREDKAQATVHLDVTEPDKLDLTQTHYVNFLFNKTALTRPSQEKVDMVANVLADSPELEVWVFAHTDSRGTNRYNLDLSKRRASAIRNLLITRGIDAKRVKANGVGESRPLVDNSTEAGRAINRRGEFHFRNVADR